MVMRGGVWRPLKKHGGYHYGRRRNTGIQERGHVKTEDWSHALIHQETPDISANHQKLGRGKKRFPTNCSGRMARLAP